MSPAEDRPSADTADPLFVGFSEVARLMRQVDWARSPVGPPQAWPQSVRAILRRMLTSRYAMWMGWGPDLTFFYNDAYARMSLGRSTRGRLAGHATRMAHDGPTALQVSRHFRPAIAFVDIGLPVMDGFELARRIRGDARVRSMRLVAVTGYGQPHDRARTAAAGFDAHLVKPVDLQQVFDAITPTMDRPSSAAP